MIINKSLMITNLMQGRLKISQVNSEISLKKPSPTKQKMSEKMLKNQLATQNLTKCMHIDAQSIVHCFENSSLHCKISAFLCRRAQLTVRSHSHLVMLFGPQNFIRSLFLLKTHPHGLHLYQN